MRVDMGKVVSTVRGLRPVSDLGVTLSHEHIAIDTTPRQKSIGSTAPRMLLDYTSEAAVTDALRKYKLSGGSSIFEATPDGCGRNPEKLREISERLDIHIICATGWYRQENYPDHVLSLGASGRTDLLMRELAHGIASTGIRPGFIKIGTSTSVTAEEEITLRAAARAQREAQVGLAIHMTNLESDGHRLQRLEMPSAHKTLDILEYEGANLTKVSLCHADGTYLDSRTALPLHVSLLRRGVYLSYDQFALNPIPEPGISARPTDDADRIRVIVGLLEADQNFIYQLLLSQDVSTHRQLAMARGNAYAHLLTSVCPQMEDAGLSPEHIRILLESNPASFVSTPNLPNYMYRDPVDNFGKSAWYWHRSVRTQNDAGGLYFPPEYVPVLADPALKNISDDLVQKLLASHLAIHLRFTSWLELNPVLQVCRDIFEGHFASLALPESVRHTALAIMNDEVSHTDLCSEYLRELEQSVALPEIDVEGIYHRALQSFVQSTPAGWRELALLAYVLASETTFTATLALVPSDQRVRPQIRELLRDHAEDERRHQVYFSEILRTLWMVTPIPDQPKLAELLRRALQQFLSPKPEVLHEMLRHIAPELAEEIADRVMDSKTLRQEIQLAAQPMVNILRDVGAFENSDVERIFHDSDLDFLTHMPSARELA